MRILGISALYHDSAAALLEDGKLVAAAQEERFSRKKHDARFPKRAIQFCLDQSPGEVDYIVFYDKPFLKFERLLETYLEFSPRGFRSFSKALPVWLKDKLFQKAMLRKELKAVFPNMDLQNRLLFSEHHLSHAASAFFPSPFENAVVLTMDGVGEWTTTSIAKGQGNNLELLQEIHFPHSLGLLYSAFTYFCGFKVNSGEYKLMGLAPYGVPKYANLIRKHLIHVKEDGSFQINLEYFDYCTGLTMVNRKFPKLFGFPVRQPEDVLEQKHMDVAASIQLVTEEVVLKLAEEAKKLTGLTNLCLAGGVALNCVANGVVSRAKLFDQIWVQPAAGDAGGALGAALAAHYLFLNQPRVVNSLDSMSGSYLGTEYGQDEIVRRLKQAGAVIEEVQSESDLVEEVSDLLSQGKAVGWFQGRMEFGPRALGNRSILADPRPSDTQKRINLKIKFRESFRPFAPSITKEAAKEWFGLVDDSPYMLMVAPVNEAHRRQMTEAESKLFGIEKLNVPRSGIPAVTHVDYSARVQTVESSRNPRYHHLLRRFGEKTGVPVLVNTSFNVRGEPIVESPEDAFHCFMGTGLDVLAIGNCILRKENQNAELAKDYREQFELD
ncbi:MAG: carbamoyltransferase [Bdellovibrionota bacterium]